jgi:hypothetical protein
VVAFASPVALPGPASAASDALAADLDGDGDMDVVTASAGSDTIAWHPSSGGSFGAGQVIAATAAGVRALAVADLDRDGDLDVLAASPADDTIAWHENATGNGSAWTPHPLTSQADGARDVGVADLDRDGDLDVVAVSEHDDRVAWFENPGGSAPIFLERTIDVDPDGAGPLQGIADGASAVAVADVDGDGDLDVLVASALDHSVTLFANATGDATSWSAIPVSSSVAGAVSLAAADVDGDGALDVVAAAETGGTITWHRNAAGDGSLWVATPITASASAPGAVSTADLDADGDLDVLSASAGDDTVAWHENLGGSGASWTFHAVATDALGVRSAVAADLDGDGDLDVLAAAAAADEVAWSSNQTLHRSAATGPAQILTTAAAFARAVTAADLDGDGDLDVLSAAQTANEIAWYENTDGAGSFAAAQQVASAAGAFDVVATDLDGDGDLDVLGAASLAGAVVWVPNIGSGSFGPSQTIHAGDPSLRSVAAGDLDGDGDVDVASASSGGDAIAWYRNAGAGTAWTRHDISLSADAASGVAIADVNGDGRPDVLSASMGDDAIAWYENDGASTPGFLERIVTQDPDGDGPLIGVADGAADVAAGDLDGDGDLDLLSASAWDNEVRWYENVAGDGLAWSPLVISSSAMDVRAVITADLDRDGDLDVLSASKDDRKVAWYENDAGDASSWTEHVVTTEADKAFSVAAADLDHDGDLDVLSASRDDHEIAWYENRGGQYALASEATLPLVPFEGEGYALLELELVHRGRASDADLELAGLGLLVEETAGDPLSNAEADALISQATLHRDDGSGVYEPGNDASIATLAGFALVAGVQTLVPTDGDPGARVSANAPGRFFLVVQLTPDAASKSPARFRLTALSGASAAEDADRDVPLQREAGADTAAEVSYIGTASSDADGDALLDGVETGTGIFASPSDTGSDPFEADTDGDGMNDGDEVAIGRDPNRPVSAPGPGVALGALLAAALAATGSAALRARPSDTTN